MTAPDPKAWWDRLPAGARAYAADAAVALLVLAVYYAPLAIPRDPEAKPFSPWAWVILACSALPLLFRRRFPILCLLAIAASVMAYNTVDRVPSQPTSWGILVATYSIAWVGRRWQRYIVLALLIVMGVSTVKSPTTAAIGLLTGIGALVLGTLAQRREQRLQDLAYRAGQLERDKEAEAVRAVTTERARIARDMHDVLAHAVSVMVVQAEAGPVAVRTMPDRAEKAFDAIAAAGRDAMTQLRRTLGILKEEQDTGVRAPQPTVAAIPSLVAQVEETGLAASYSVSGSGRLTADAEVAAYRIVQEALTNTLKHAAATKVAVTLDWGESLVITVRDDGTGSGALAASGTVGGSGTLGNSGTVGGTGTLGNSGTVGGTATLGNSGTLGGTATLGNSGTLGGTATLGNSGTLGGSGTLAGSGTLGGTGTVGGSGTLGGTGNGLIGIRERAAACGGTASAHGDADGFTVTATLPVVVP
ncbi:sensor histidine kinase [Actinoallomurus sp. CA-150999]|uniref:sensor histidine kinase n=1 Tax=Actinoallomurus sp. CA-150999 TaxID=3239887 RepID=UPI003D8A985C